MTSLNKSGHLAPETYENLGMDVFLYRTFRLESNAPKGLKDHFISPVKGKCRFRIFSPYHLVFFLVNLLDFEVVSSRNAIVRMARLVSQEPY